MLQGRVVAGIVVVVAVALGGCSSDDKPEADSVAAAKASTTTTTARPAGPGRGSLHRDHGWQRRIPAVGKVERGRASHRRRRPGTSCTSTSPRAPRRRIASTGAVVARRPLDLRARMSRRSTSTRVVVRRPENLDDFSGNVIVEWLNVSGGVDSAADYDTTYEEIAREGHIFVGVSAQLIGVMGGPVLVEVPEPGGTHLAGQGLRKRRPRALQLARPSW